LTSPALPAVFSMDPLGPYKTRNGAQQHNGADVHQNLPKNYLKLGIYYGIGFRVRIRIRYRLGLVFRFSD